MDVCGSRTVADMEIEDDLNHLLASPDEGALLLPDNREPLWKNFLLKLSIVQTYKRLWAHRTPAYATPSEHSTRRMRRSMRKTSYVLLENEDDLAFLDGTKVIAFLWIVAFFTCLFLFISQVHISISLFDLFANPLVSFVLAGSLAVDMFLFLSLFLGFHKLNTLCEIENGGEISSWIALKFIGSRVVTLMPIYLLVLLTGWLVIPFVGEGPGWF